MALLGMTLENLIGGLIILLGLGLYSARCLLQSDDRRNLAIKLICSALFILLGFFILWRHSIVLAFLYILPAIVIGCLWLPNIGEYLSKPLTDSFDGGKEGPEMKPFYFRAE